MTPPLLERLDARDRALFVRMALDGRNAHPLLGFWMTITHLGGARASIGACVVTLAIPTVTVRIVWHALLLLGLSHVVVQIVKRFAVRERPSIALSINAMIAIPDRFSFPSGHACAAMSIAIAFAWAFPLMAVPLLLTALLVGCSRVTLGVHYPGDVAVGQAIAILSAYVLLPIVG